ncbi:MAG: hypothetical protein WC816_07720 [Sphingomonas sp.]|jgi:hypothetical protein
MTDVDRQIARSAELLTRTSANYRQGAAYQRRKQGVARRLTRIAVANVLILFGAITIGLGMPLGMFGALGVVTLMIAATIALMIFPTTPEPTAEKLRETNIRALPAQTQIWLDAQRPALPAPAITLVDQIGARLRTLEPQLAQLKDDDPAALEVRKLIGEQLPDFMKGYAGVPLPLRGVERNGRTPDAQLVDGLKVIDGQIAEMTEQLAQGSLDSLETHGRYLEIKYRGDEGA